MRYQYILIIFFVSAIISSGCISDTEYSDDELVSIALNDPEVKNLIDSYDYKTTDSGRAKLNGKDSYYVKILIEKDGKAMPYKVFINQAGSVFFISKEFPSIDPASVEHKINTNKTL